MTKRLEDRIEDVTGAYFDILSRLNAETIQHADQIARARLRSPNLRLKPYWTGDFPLYVEEDGHVILYLGRIEVNPIINNPNKAYTGLTEKGFYVPTLDEIEKVKESKRTVRVELSDIKSQSCGNNGDCMFYEFSTSQAYPFPYDDGRQLIERIYGTGNDFDKYMEVIDSGDDGWGSTGIHFIPEDYAKELMGDKPGIGFIASFNSVKFGSCFMIYRVNTEVPKWMRAVKLDRV